MNPTTRLAVFLLFISGGLNIAQAQKFYKKEHGLFSTRPNESSSLQTIKRFGPVGIGIDLIQPAFTMRVSHIEKGSPAESVVGLEAGQIIESINGQKLADIDPRIQLGQILAKAEATDGKIRFNIKGQSHSHRFFWRRTTLFARSPKPQKRFLDVANQA